MAIENQIEMNLNQFELDNSDDSYFIDMDDTSDLFDTNDRFTIKKFKTNLSSTLL
jgi:hypothetical protein